MGYLNSVLSSTSQVRAIDDGPVSGGGLRYVSCILRLPKCVDLHMHNLFRIICQHEFKILSWPKCIKHFYHAIFFLFLIILFLYLIITKLSSIFKYLYTKVGIIWKGLFIKLESLYVFGC